METLKPKGATNLPEIWGKRSGTFSDHDFEYYNVAVRGGEIRSRHSLAANGEATVDQILRNNRSFLQIFGRNGAQSNQVATVSFGLSGGVETINDLAEEISRGLGTVEIRYYGEGPLKNQINVFAESDSLDPMFLLGRMVDAPKEVYAGIEGLTAQVEAQRLRRKTLLESRQGKGSFYEDIFYERVDGDIRPLEKVDGSAEFGWGYWVRGGELWNQGQSMTSLAIDFRVDCGMRDSLLDIQTYLVETPIGKRRFVFKIDGHPTTEECCPRATNAQMGEANYNKTHQFYQESKDVRLNQMKIFGYESKNICSSCKGDKDSTEEHKKCSCTD